jgi:hypothetical protein
MLKITILLTVEAIIQTQAYLAQTSGDLDGRGT